MQRVNSVVLLIGFWIVLLGNGFPTLAAIFYRNQTLKDWCDPHPILKVVRRIINQPNDFFVTRENSLQITHRWETTFNSECLFRVEAERGAGLVVNINQLFFRMEHNRDSFGGDCMDYVRLKFKNGTKTQRMCGLVNATASSFARRSFAVPDGEIEIKIKIDDIRKLRGREHLYVDFLFTQFNDCNQPTSFKCEDQMCIHQKYVNDGNINCPYPLCSDEASCLNKTIVIPAMGSSKRAIIGGIAAAVVLAVLVPITVCCCCEFCRKGAVSGRRHRRSGGGGSSAGPSSSSNNSSGEVRSPGGRRQRHRSNRSASRGHFRGDEASGRPNDIGFTAIVRSSPPPPMDDQKESPPPTYDSLFPDR